MTSPPSTPSEDAPQAAQDGGGKALEAQHGPHVVDPQGKGRNQNAPGGPQGRGQPEGELHHAAHRDAHQAGGLAVIGAGPHGFPQDGEAEKGLQEQHQEAPQAHDPEILGEERGGEDMERGAAGEGRQGIGLLAPDNHGQTLEKHRAAHGDDDEHDGGLVADRAQGQALEEQARHGDHGHRADEGQGQGRDKMIKADGAHGPQHDHLTLGEVDDGGGVVDDAEAQGDEGVDGAVGEAGDEKLQKGSQAFQEAVSIQIR